MKKISLIALLTLMMTVVSFQGKAQEVSSVIITGITYGGSIRIEIIRPDYTVEKKEFSRKENANFFVEIKRELDEWMNKGFYIDKTNSNSESALNYRYTYILIKKEE